MRRYAIATLILLAAATAQGQLPSPRLAAVSPPGGQAGTTVAVTLSSGGDLDEASQLLFSHPGIAAAQRTTDPAPYQTGPQPLTGQFQVTIAPDVPPGVYEVRALGRFGVSTPRAFTVGDQPEIIEVEPNNELVQAQPLPINTVVSGLADGEPVDCFRFEGRAGTTYVIDCWAYRIDSRMDASLQVLDASGRELARGRDDDGLDPRIVFRAPTDGAYVVRSHDFTYQGGVEHFYRLAVRDTPHIEFVVPPAGQPGTTQTFVLYGYNLPGGEPVNDAQTAGATMERLNVDIAVPTVEAFAERGELGGLLESTAATVDQFVYRLAGPRGASNPVRIGLATAPTVLEASTDNDRREHAQAIAPPCEIAGQFHPDRDVDWYSFEAKQGETYWIEVIAARLGEPVDAELTIEGGGAQPAASPEPNRNRRGRGRRGGNSGVTQGEGVQILDDTQSEIGGGAFRTATSDPMVAWTAPQDGIHRVSVRNLFAATKSEARRDYRLSIRKARPDFRLVTSLRQAVKDDAQLIPGALSLQRGEQIYARVVALRKDGFNGPIHIQAQELPPGVTAPQVVIGEGENTTFLPISAAEDAAAWCGELRIVGQATIGDAPVTRIAATGDLLFPAQPNQLPPARPRVATISVLAVVNHLLPFSAASGAGDAMVAARNAKVSIPINITRRGDVKVNVIVRPLQLPRGLQLAEITIPADQTAGAMELVVAGDAPLGDFSIPLQTEAAIPYRRNPESAERAEAEKQVAEKLAADAAAAVATAEQAKQTAEAALAAADPSATNHAELTSARDVAVKAAADAAAKAQSAEQAKQAATQRATDAATAAQQRDVIALGSAGAITVRITEAPSP